MDTALLALRVALSLACVLGLIWFAGRRLQGTAGLRKPRSVPMTVLGRQTLGTGAGLALVEVAGRVLLLGVGEQGVRVLVELDVPAASEPTGRGTEVREEIDLSTLLGTSGADGGPAVPAPAAAGVPHAHLDGVARLNALLEADAGRDAERGTRQDAAQPGALHGSVLSPDTWRRAVDVVQHRTARR